MSNSKVTKVDTMVENNVCPIGNTLDFFNRKWIFCILSNIFLGMKHFSEFKKVNPTISNHILSETLKYMEENNLVSKTTIEDGSRVQTEYSLTEKGLKTNKILYEITSYYFNELNYAGYDDAQRQEVLKEYEQAFNIR